MVDNQNIEVPPSIQLNNGAGMPSIGLGVYRAEDGGEVERAISFAIESGYRKIDTAQYYNNEAGVGRAIKSSIVPRSEIYLTTKLSKECYGYEATLLAFQGSLERLDVEYVDLFLIHWPFVDREKTLNYRESTWKAMEEIYKSGSAKSIGVSNYTEAHLEEMKGYSNIKPVVNQVELHPFLYQKKLLNYCTRNDIIVEAYCPLVRGTRLDNEVLKRVALKHNKTTSQILIRWSIQIGCVPIPKSTNPSRIAENIDVYDFELNDADMSSINALNEDFHIAWNPY